MKLFTAIFSIILLTKTACFALSVEVVPYFWAINIYGDVGVKDIPPAEINLSFRKVLEEFKGGVAAITVARHNCFVGFLDATYLHLQTKRQATTTTVTLDQETFIGTVAAGYHIGLFDFFAGARHFAFTTTLSEPSMGSRSSKVDWTDPLIGCNFVLPLNSKTDFQILADVGGFGVGSHLQWEILPTLRFLLNKQLSFYWGYRLLYLNYGNSQLKMTSLTEGWIGGLGFNF